MIHLTAPDIAGPHGAPAASADASHPPSGTATPVALHPGAAAPFFPTQPLDLGAPAVSSPLHAALVAPLTPSARAASPSRFDPERSLFWPFLVGPAVAPPRPNPAQVARDALVAQFCATDYTAELGQALGEEQQRFAHIQTLLQADPTAFGRWEPTPKTRLLLQWVDGQASEAQAMLLGALPDDFKHAVDQRRGFTALPLYPIDVLGDRWMQGETPEDTALAARFAPAAAPTIGVPPMPRLPMRESRQTLLCQTLPRLEVHGTSESKGGLRTFANILLEGHLAPHHSFGALHVCSGPLDLTFDRSVSGGRHGPFYTVLDPDVRMQSSAGGLPEATHVAYIVPTQTEIDKLKAALALAQRLGQISPEQQAERVAKLVCYTTLLHASSPLAERLHQMGAPLADDSDPWQAQPST